MSGVEGLQVGRDAPNYVERILIEEIESARECDSQPEVCGLPGGAKISTKWRRLWGESALFARPGVGLPLKVGAQTLIYLGWQDGILISQWDSQRETRPCISSYENTCHEPGQVRHCIQVDNAGIETPG